MGQDAAIHVLDEAHPLAAGPGGLGCGGVAGAVVWRAGGGERDLFGGFWRDEAPGMDWLTGYLCDADTMRVFARLGEQEAEELSSRACMNTPESSLDTR